MYLLPASAEAGPLPGVVQGVKVAAGRGGTGAANAEVGMGGMAEAGTAMTSAVTIVSQHAAHTCCVCWRLRGVGAAGFLRDGWFGMAGKAPPPPVCERRYDCRAVSSQPAAAAGGRQAGSLASAKPQESQACTVARQRSCQVAGGRWHRHLLVVGDGAVAQVPVRRRPIVGWRGGHRRALGAPIRREAHPVRCDGGWGGPGSRGAGGTGTGPGP